MSPEFWDHMQPHHSMLLSEPLKVEASTCHCFAWQSDSEIVPHLQTPDKKRETRTTGWRLYVPKKFWGCQIWNLAEPQSDSASARFTQAAEMLRASNKFQSCYYWHLFRKFSVFNLNIQTCQQGPCSMARCNSFSKAVMLLCLGRYTQTGGCPSLIKP